MSTENNGNILNDAVEQVNTDETSVRPSEGTANQNNQQSTTANTVATGADLQAPQVSADSQPAESSSEENQGRDENSNFQGQQNQSPNTANGQSNSAQSSPVGNNDNQEETNNPNNSQNSAQNSSQNNEVQGVGGTEPSQQGLDNGRQSNQQNEPQNQDSENAPSSNGREQNNSDEITDNHSFDVNVAGPTRSDELENSDSIEDEFSFDVDITAVNDAVAIDENSIPAFNTDEDSVIHITEAALLANASDVDGDDLTVTNLSIDNATFTTVIDPDTGDRTFIVTPDENVNGDLVINFNVTDSQGSTIVSGAELVVEAVNDAPVLAETIFTINEDNSIIITPADLIPNTSDVDGDTVTVTDISANDHGSVTQNIDGNWVFSPDENYAGDATLTISLSDGTATTEHNATVSITPDADVPSLTVSPAETVLIDSESAPSITTGWLTDNANGFIELEANRGDESNIYQDLNVSAGDTVTLSFDLSARKNYEGEDSQVNVYFDGELVDVIIPEQVGWNTFTYQLTATTDNPRLEFNAPGDNGLGAVLDQINVVETEIFAEDTAVSLDINPALTDTDGSEEIDSVVLDAVMIGATITDGTNEFVASEGNDSVDVKDWDLSTLTFQGPQDFVGDVSLDVTVTAIETATGDSAQTTETIEFNIFNVNDPVVIDENSTPAFNTDEDSVLHITESALLANASDVDGDDLTVTNLSIDNATFTTVIDPDTGDRTFVVIPDENVNGDLAINFNVTDSQGSEITSSAELIVAAVNDLLTTTGDTVATIDEDTSITINQAQLLANAADIDGDTLTASNLSAINATVIDNGNGTFSITPEDNFNGHIDVSYDISDGSVLVASNLGLTVDPVNDAPIISADVTVTITEDGAYTVSQAELLQFASDIDGHTMMADIGEQGVETSATGIVVDASTGIGIDGAVVTLADEAGNTITTTTDPGGYYTVQGDIIDDGSVTIEQDGCITNSYNVSAGNSVDTGTTALSTVMDADQMRVVLTWGDNPRDLDNHLWLFDTETGDQLDHIYFNDMSHNLGDGTARQDVDALNGNGPETITIPNFSEADMHYSVHNYSNNSWQVGGVDKVSVEIYVGDTLIQSFTPDIPSGMDGSHWHVFDIVDGVVVPTQSAAAENQFTLPSSDTVAADPEGINIVDSITGVDEETDEDTSNGTLDNEDLPSSEESAVNVDNIQIPNGDIIDNGDGTYTIVPDENFNGEFSISYDVIDSLGASTSAQLDVTVTAVNDNAVLVDHDYNLNEDDSITITDSQLLLNSSDVDTGDVLSVMGVTYSGADGVLTDNGNGSHTFSPNPNFNGEVNLSYSVSDGTDTTAANISLNIAAINDAPVAPAITMSGVEDQTLTIEPAYIVDKVSDIDSNNLTLGNIVIRHPDNATLSLNQDGTYQVLVPENFNGLIDLNYAVSDGELTTEGSLNLNIMAVDDKPFQTGNAHLAAVEDGSVTFYGEDLIDLFSDVDSVLTISRVITADGEEAEGNLLDNGDGSWTFTPTDNFAGTNSLVVIATDGSSEATLDMNIYVRPIADGVAISTDFEGPLVFSEDSSGFYSLNIDQLDTSEVITCVMMTGYPVGFIVGDGVNSILITEEGQAVDISNWDMDSMSITPPSDFNGSFSVTVSVVSLDEVESPSLYDVTEELGSQPNENTPFIVDEDGSVLITAAELLETLDGAETLDVSTVDYNGDDGTLIDNNNGTWTFWASPDYIGNIDIAFITSDGQEHIQLVSVPTDADDEPEIQKSTVEPTVNDNNSDYTVAPGNSVNIMIDEDIVNNADIDSVVMSGLPDGIEPQNGVELDGGDFVISGELSQPITLDVADEFSGEVTMTLSGIDSQDQPVDGATQEVIIDVDESYAMQGSSANNADPLAIENGGENTDWTTADNSAFVVDPMDDHVAIEQDNEPSVDDDITTGMDI